MYFSVVSHAPSNLEAGITVPSGNVTTSVLVNTLGSSKFPDIPAVALISPAVFVDMENDYRTMNPTYTETVWWIFKKLHEKGLVYEGFKSMHLCPHCGTTLSNFEIAQGYKDITDISVTVKFELLDDPIRTDAASATSNGAGQKTFFLAWTKIGRAHV